MTREETRRQNARLLAKEAGSLTAFGKALDMSDSQVNQIIGKNPVKNIGNKIAERIELAFRKPAGWLDRDRAVVATSIPMGISNEPTSDTASSNWPFTMSLQDILQLPPEELAPLDRYVSYTVMEWRHKQTHGTLKKESAIDKHTDGFLQVDNKKNVG